MTTLRHPFGTTITDENATQIFAPLNQWEDKYRQLIFIGQKAANFDQTSAKRRLKRLPDAKTASGWDIPWLKTVKCTSLATAKEALCAVCWRVVDCR